MKRREMSIETNPFEIRRKNSERLNRQELEEELKFKEEMALLQAKEQQ